jgi:hypothetical protein
LKHSLVADEPFRADLPPAENRLLWLAALLPLTVASWGARIVGGIVGAVAGFGAVVVGLFVFVTFSWFVIALFVPAFQGAFAGMLSVTVPLLEGAGGIALVLAGIVVATGVLSGVLARIQQGVHEGVPRWCCCNVGLYGASAVGMYLFTRGFERQYVQYQGDPGYVVTTAGLYGVAGLFVLLAIVTIVGTAIEHDDWPP